MTRAELYIRDVWGNEGACVEQTAMCGLAPADRRSPHGRCSVA